MPKKSPVEDRKVEAILTMMELNKELTNAAVARAWDVSERTVQQIRDCGSLEKWLKYKDERKKIQRERKAAKAAEEQTEPEVPGQIRMELEQKSEMSDTVKMMRFQAHEVELIIKAVEDSTVRLITELDRLNDTLSMILRAVRKE